MWNQVYYIIFFFIHYRTTYPFALKSTFNIGSFKICLKSQDYKSYKSFKIQEILIHQRGTFHFHIIFIMVLVKLQHFKLTKLVIEWNRFLVGFEIRFRSNTFSISNGHVIQRKWNQIWRASINWNGFGKGNKAYSQIFNKCKLNCGHCYGRFLQ